MPYTSVAIIRKMPRLRTDNPHPEYLVLQRLDRVPFFFEITDQAIGASFQLSRLIESIFDFFGLAGIKASESFLTPPKAFRISYENPAATAFIFELTESQVENISVSVNSNRFPDIELSWVSEPGLVAFKNQWRVGQKFIFTTERPFSNPAFDNELRANLTKIVEAKNNGKLVIFAGAGISADSDAPDWRDLIESLKADVTTDSNDFLEIAQLYYHARGHKEYYDKVLELLKYGRTFYNPNHSKITELRPVHIVTTNYDDHFEQVITENALGYSTIRQDIDLPFAKGSSLYVKMHGDLGIKRIVLKQQDYNNYSTDFPLILSFIRETFASKLVLFLGFSFTDSNLAKIISDVKEILKANVQPPYIFIGDISDDKNKKHWQTIEENGVRTIPFTTAVKNYYDQIERQEDIERVKKLSERGKDVYMFLRVVEEFEPISDKLDKFEVGKLLSASLRRFDGLTAIPIPVLCKTTPFKIKIHPRYTESANAELDYYHPYTLQTSNEDLLHFLKIRKGDKASVGFLHRNKKSMSIEEQNIHAALRTVYLSGIRRISRKNDTTQESYKIEPDDENPNCMCLRCMVRRLEFRDTLISFSNRQARALCEVNYLDEKLLEGYAYFKTAQPVKSFFALEAAAQSALKKSDYVTYFIAILNQLELEFRIRFRHENEIDTHQVERLLDKIARTNKYEILNRLPVENIVRESLQYIMENRIFHDVSSSIKEDLQRIKKNYQNYRRDAMRGEGPIAWLHLEAKIFLIWNFYHQNLLFNDDTPEFWDISESYVEAIIASYATSSKDKNRVTKIWPFFNLMATKYCTSEFLRDILWNYKIDLLDQQSETNDVLNNLHALLDSGYNRSTYFGESLERNSNFDALVNSSSNFKAQVNRLFSNHLLLLKHMPLTATEVNTTIDKVIYFVNVNSMFGWSGALKPFTDFVARHIQVIDNVRQNSLLELSLLDDVWSGQIIYSISKTFVEARKTNMISVAFLEKLDARKIERRKWPLSTKETFPLYPLMDQPAREKFLRTVLAPFKETPITSDILKDGSDHGLWTPESHPDLFDPFFYAVIRNAHAFPQYKITKHGYPKGDNFQPWIDMYFAIRMLYKYDAVRSKFSEEYLAVAKYSYLKWIIDPDHFNYSKFKAKWFLTFASPDILPTIIRNQNVMSAVESKLRTQYNPKAYKLFTESLERIRLGQVEAAS